MTEKFKADPKAFSENLNLALDQLGWPKHGRIAQLARAMSDDLKGTSVRRWLNGEGLPEVKRLAELSRIAQKSVEWLLTGKTLHPEYDLPAKPTRKIIKLHAFRLDDLQSFDAELIALCDDGSIWVKQGIHSGAEWMQIDSIPQ